MGSNVEATQSAAPALLALSAQSTLVRTTLCNVGSSCDGMTSTPRVQPVEPVAVIPLGGFCEGGQAQAASTARPVPTHHNLDKSWLIKFVEHRVADPRFLRLIQKWLNAGVMEEGQWSEMKTGTPQGSVASPILANIYLHHVFDLWVNNWRKKFARGEVVVVRYADDTILGFQHQADADRFLESFRQRLWKFGLELHPDKTRTVEFGRFAERNREQRGAGKPETFDFLGFTHISGKNRKGIFTVRRTTIRKRMRKKLQEIKQQLRQRMHDPVPQTGEWLKSVVQGYFNYYAVPGNLDSLGVFRDRLLRLWGQSLRCRSQKSRPTWAYRVALANRWLPHPRVLHPYPADRFAASHPR